jgi:TRAP-type C4-dicarboxylate transport system permease small subunit
MGHAMRRTLDFLYIAGLWLSAGCLLLIAVLVGLQVGARLLDLLLRAAGFARSGFVILSLSEIAGYLLAAASFLALAATLKSGVQIRVTMLVNNVPPRARMLLEAGALLFAALATAYATWHLGIYAHTSFVFNDVSPGLVRVPLFYPQAAMVVGAALLTIAFIDEFVITLRTGRTSFSAAEDAISTGTEA